MGYKPNLVKNYTIFITALLLTVMANYGCNNTINDVLRPKVNMEVVNEENLAITSFLDAYFIGYEGYQIAIADSLSRSQFYNKAFFLNSQCGTVQLDTIDQSAFQLKINFGEENCQGKNERLLRGTLIINWSNGFSASGTTLIYSFENFQINRTGLEGTLTVDRLEKNDYGNLKNSLKTNGTLIKNRDTTKIRYQGEFIQTQTEGTQTKKLNDDQYIITGRSSGKSSMGIPFTGNINDPLLQIMDENCYPTFIKGSQSIVPENNPARNVRFGNGTCDNAAQVEIGDLTYPVKFQR